LCLMRCNIFGILFAMVYNAGKIGLLGGWIWMKIDSEKWSA
jgi:hypothetical protein